jgi:hypothetical protein
MTPASWLSNPLTLGFLIRPGSATRPPTRFSSALDLQDSLPSECSCMRSQTTRTSDCLPASSTRCCVITAASVLDQWRKHGPAKSTTRIRKVLVWTTTSGFKTSPPSNKQSRFRIVKRPVDPDQKHRDRRERFKDFSTNNLSVVLESSIPDGVHTSLTASLRRKSIALAFP